MGDLRHLPSSPGIVGHVGPVLTHDEVALLLRCSRRSVSRLVAGGHLTPVAIAGNRRYHRDDVEAYIARQREDRP